MREKDLYHVFVLDYNYKHRHHNQNHHFDGYDEQDIAEMAKSKPQIRSDYYKYREVKDEY